ncbi:unnamed protein product, partial [marine sediment metagenome]
PLWLSHYSFALGWLKDGFCWTQITQRKKNRRQKSEDRTANHVGFTVINPTRFMSQKTEDRIANHVGFTVINPTRFMSQESEDFGVIDNAA